MKKTVEYKNVLNDVVFKDFNAMDLDLFFLGCTMARDRGSEIVEIPLDEVKTYIGYNRHEDRDFLNEIEEMEKKQMTLLQYGTVVINDKKYNAWFHLFNLYGVSEDGKTLLIQVSPQFFSILNKLDSNFTRFEFENFAKLKSKYSKNLYRLLKQWRVTGKVSFTWDEICEKMDISKKYKPGEAVRRCIMPAFEEVRTATDFRDLKMTLDKKHAKGAPLVGVTYTWKAEKVKNRRGGRQKPAEQSAPSGTDAA